MSNIENLEKALKAGGYDTQPQIPTLKVEEVDISGWTEFWDFFDKPMSKSTVYQYPGVEGTPGLLLPCAFISVVSANKKQAVARLRRDLWKLHNSTARVVAFLAKPSVIELVSEPRENEIADTVMTKDLRGPVPAKRRYAAFCFLHGYRDDRRLGEWPVNLDQRTLKTLGIDSAVSEGEVGNDIDFDRPLEMIHTDLALTPVSEDPSEAFVTVNDDEIQEQLYPLPPMPPGQENILLKPNGKTELVITGVNDPVEAVAYMHPEFKAAADKHGIDLTKPPGRELEQMRKFFGQGSGLYLVTVDFQTARSEAFKLDERAQKKIAIALKVKKPKRKNRAKKQAKVARKPTRVRRSKRS
jgi:hypothetical protein